MNNSLAKPLQFVDGMLNKIPMYKVAWGLGGLLIIAFIYAATGVLSLSATGLATSVVLLTVVCYVSNQLFAKLFRVATNAESWIITAFILACIVPPADSLGRAGAIAAVGVISMAVKYLLVIRGSHIFNPAAAGALVGSLTGILPITWWIGSPPMLPFTIILGLLVLRKTRRFELFFFFAAAALAMMLLVGGMNGTPVSTTLSNAFLSWPLVFLGTIMLTEPATLPAGRLYLALYGALVGVIFGSQLHGGGISASPHLALLIGNIFSVIVTPKRTVQVRLKKRTPIGPNLYDFSFVYPAGKRLTYQPGQYAEWTLPHKRSDLRGNRRTFSLASAPDETDLHIGIKTYEPSSSFKKALMNMQEGDYIQVGHVGGSFTLPQDASEKLLFIAGGIGITPFRSMLQAIIDGGERRDITLVYAVRDQAEAVYADVLDAAKTYGLKLVVLTEKLSSESLRVAVPDSAARHCYISGPDAMVRATKVLLHDTGVPRRRIHTDYFTGY